MTTIDRRSLFNGMMCVAIVASIGFTVMPKAAHATPLATGVAGVVKPGALIEKTRVTIHVNTRRVHRHRRHHRCWWHRGRRVCGWR